MPMGAYGSPPNLQELAPNLFKSAAVNAAGDTNIWVPTAGKRFRLLRFFMVLTSNASLAVAGILTVNLTDAGGALGLSIPAFVPGAAGTLVGQVPVTPGWVDLGEGVLSVAVNNALRANLSVALATGSLGILMAGDEE